MINNTVCNFLKTSLFLSSIVESSKGFMRSLAGWAIKKRAYTGQYSCLKETCQNLSWNYLMLLKELTIELTMAWQAIRVCTQVKKLRIKVLNFVDIFSKMLYQELFDQNHGCLCSFECLFMLYPNMVQQFTFVHIF